MRQVGSLWVPLLGGIFLLSLGVGCTQTAMLPAHQLEQGSAVVSGGIDVSGGGLPRAQGQFTYGVGGADLSVNLGISAYPDAGVAGRLYLSEHLTGEAQVRAAAFGLESGEGFWDDPPYATSILGVESVPTNDDPFYFGAQAGIVGGDELSFVSQPKYITYPIVGATVGLGHLELGANWRMQVELEGNVPISPGEDAPLPPTRLSVGFFRLID